jgi:uncharacterized protein YacL
LFGQRNCCIYKNQSNGITDKEKTLKKVELIYNSYSKIIGIANSIVGLITGIYLFDSLLFYILPTIGASTGIKLLFTSLGYYAFGGILFSLIFYFLTPTFINSTWHLLAWVEDRLKAVSTRDIALVTATLIVTLLLGYLISYPMYRIPGIGNIVAPFLFVFIVCIGIKVVLDRKEDFAFITTLFNRGFDSKDRSSEEYKILDTSTIIDGRIVDICRTGFLEGTLVVAVSVLEEIQKIADSADLLQRNRGRRGLDMLNIIQKDLDVPVWIYEDAFEETTEIDIKLIKLARAINGSIVTSDYNLNKVCEVQGIGVLSIDGLADAIKPVVLPGEFISASVIKDGKEPGQGIAYLNDGTMIVVENGRRLIGETIKVQVTNVMQTATGRMIFAVAKLRQLQAEGVLQHAVSVQR